MIEYKAKFLNGPEDDEWGQNWREKISWREIPMYHTCRDCLFRHGAYRIQGKIYKKFSGAFVKAFEQERIWEKLSV